MPAAQANAYTDAIRRGRGAQGSAILGVLQGLRGVSLHPYLRQSTAVGSDAEWIAASARVAATMEILDGIHAKGEKALIFLESLDLQDARELGGAVADRAVQDDVAPRDRAAGCGEDVAQARGRIRKL